MVKEMVTPKVGGSSEREDLKKGMDDIQAALKALNEPATPPVAVVTPPAPTSPATRATPPGPRPPAPAAPTSAPTPPATPPPAPATPTGNPVPKDVLPANKKSKETKPSVETPEQEIKGFIDEYKLESALPSIFSVMTVPQQLKVVRDLKQRIVDIVKSDAQTQYSEELKKKSKTSAIASSLVKEGSIKGLEKETFKKLQESPAGKAIIARDLQLLTEKAASREVQITNGKVEVIYAKGDTDAEKTASNNFNTAANKFAQVPYEWGQEKGGKHKKEYEKVKKEYEKARAELLAVETAKKPDEEVIAKLEISRLDNAIQMEQLLNTHPEVEQLLADLGKDPDTMGKVRAIAVDNFQKILGKIPGTMLYS